MRAKKCFFFLFSFFISLFLFSSIINAHYIQNFDKIPDDWTINVNESNVVVENSVLYVLGGSHHLNSYSYPPTEIFPDENYSIDLKFRFTGNCQYGSGIAFSDFLLPNDRNEEQTWQDLIFFLWPSANGTFTLYSVPEMENPVLKAGEGSIVFVGDFGVWYTLKILKDRNIYSFFIDDEFINRTSSTNRILDWIWIGNPQRTKSSPIFPNLEIDYLHITDLSAPPEKTPIIFLPGLGASWDFGALLNGTNGNEWQIPSFVTTYANLEASLKNAGYEKGVDYFIFTYDWRKNLTDLDDDLSSYISNLISEGIIENDEKLDLVGHSMGGLVARSYLQNMGSEKIRQLITLGSPHQGSTESYSIWEGATVIDRPWWQKVSLELLMELNSLPGETRVGTLRRVAPGMRDLLPTYDFLLLEDVLIPWGEMHERNEYLNSLNDVSSFREIITIFSGTGWQTKENIQVEPRGWRDRLLNRWEDGRPVNVGSFTYQDGDGTVLLSSSEANFSQKMVEETNHQGLVNDEKSLKDLFVQLGLDDSKVLADQAMDERGDVIVVALRSPGQIDVCQESVCNHDLGAYLPENKLFFLPGYQDGEISIDVREDGTGDYTLHIGRISGNESEWKKISGSLGGPGEIDSYLITDDGEGIVLQVDLQNYLEDFSIQAKRLSQVIEWNEEGLVEKMVSSETSLKNKLRTARRIRWKLYLLAQDNPNNSEVMDLLLNLWCSLDRLMEGLTFNEDFHYLSQCEYWQAVMEKHKTEAETEVPNSNNVYTVRLWEEGETKKEEIVLEDEAIPYSLLMDKINSAEYLFLTAKTLK